MFNLTEVRITKNHWSVWLLKFCFGITRRFNTYCEHFWLTILAVALFPIIGIARGIWEILNFIVDTYIGIIDRIETNYEKNLLEKIKKLSEEELEEMRLIETVRGTDRVKDADVKIHSRKYYLNLLKKMRRNDSHEVRGAYYDKIDSHVGYREQDIKYFSKLKPRIEPKPYEPSKFEIWFNSIKWKSIFMWIGKYIAAPFVGLLIVIASGILVFYCYVFISYLWNTFYVNWVVVKIAAKIVGFFILPIVIVGVGTGLLFAKGIIRTPDFPEVTIPEPVKNIFHFIFVKTIGGFFKGIGSIVLFLINGIKLFKSDNCPAIIWED